MMNDEQLWKTYNSPAKESLSEEQIARAKAWGVANGKVFDGTVTQTPKDMGTTGNLTQAQMKTAADLGHNVDASGRALDAETAQKQQALKDIVTEHAESRENTPILQQATEGVKGIGKATANAVDEAYNGPKEQPIPQVSSEVKEQTVQNNAAALNNKTDSQVKDDVNDAIDTQVPKEEQSKAYKQTRSVWQAWKDGEFGNPDSREAKSARNYFILDSLATFAASQAQQSAQLANIYRGGTADVSAYANPEDKWSQQQTARQENTLSNELSSETAMNEAATNEQIADMFKSSPQAAQALNNLILQAKADATPEQMAVTIDNMRKAGELTDAQAALLNKQLQFYDMNAFAGMLVTASKLLG